MKTSSIVASARSSKSPRRYQEKGDLSAILIPLQCSQGLSPEGLGLRPGFQTQIYHLGSSLSNFPTNRVRTRVPDAEGTQKFVQDYGRSSFFDVDRNMPNNYIAALWYGAVIVKQVPPVL
eukprot:762916-Hanusia_phi.AAC.3